MYLKSNIERLKTRKRELGWTNQTLAEKSGIPVGTLNKIFSGTTRYPREKTVDALVKALGLNYYSQELGSGAMLLREHGSYRGMKKGRQATLDTYYAMPEGIHVELIDGAFHYLPSPTLQHQEILLAMAAALCRYFQESDVSCRVFAGRCDVRLDSDEYTMVKPDLFVVRGRGQMANAAFCDGAPEFVAEIVSPEDPEHEYERKRRKYQNAGVREYWIVDFAKMRILVYTFERDGIPVMYSFEDQVRSGLYPELQVDFGRIRESIV